MKMHRLGVMLAAFLIAILACSAVVNGEYSEDEDPCTCVPLHRCRDEVTVVDIRSTGACAHYLHTCCSNVKPNVTSRFSQRPPPPSHVRRGCGQRNIDGVASWRLRNESVTAGETQFGEWPWMAAVLALEEDILTNQSTGLAYLCGGALIHKQVVLTAAHCVASFVQSPRKLKVLLGEWDTQTQDEELPVQSKKVRGVILHEKFDAGALLYDVALLVLHGAAKMADNVDTVCLPRASGGPGPGTRCKASGWGKDNFGKDGQYQAILKSIELPLISRQACQKALQSTRLSKFFRLHETFTCAGGEPGVDTCTGDGGGPLMCPVPGRAGLPDHYEQVGVVSWGIGCGERGVPGVYTDIAHMRPWIDAQMAAQSFTTDSYTWPDEDDDDNDEGADYVI